MIIDLEIFGDTVLSRELLNIQHRGEDLLPAFSLIHESFSGIEKYQFSSQGAFSGGWEPDAPSTVEAKKKQGLDLRVLHASHRLRDSLTGRSGPDHVYRTTAEEVFIGSTVPYGVYHQSRGPRTRLPRRPPVTLTEAHKRRWIRIVQRWIMTGQMTP